MAGFTLNAALVCLLAAGSEIRDDETVVFFPTFARYDAEEDAWWLPVHGVVFERELDSLRRNVLIAGVRRVLEVEPDTAEAALLDLRLRLFLVDNESGKTVSVRLGGKVYQVGTSASNGHFSGRLRLGAAEAARLSNRPRPDGAWLEFAAELPADDSRRFVGRVQLIGPRGLSVVSDIDDTVKHTQVLDTAAMLRNTFVREFQAVPGMARIYAKAAGRGAVFHYVSASPWQLAEPLTEFLGRDGFPQGSLHLRYFRLKDPSGLKVLLGSSQEYKGRAIGAVLAAFPERRFILVGDSGEHDPEVYGRLARRYPEQVAAVAIRNVTDAKLDDERFRKALAGVENRVLFRQAEELEPVFEELIEKHAAPR